MKWNEKKNDLVRRRRRRRNSFTCHISTSDLHRHTSALVLRGILSYHTRSISCSSDLVLCWMWWRNVHITVLIFFFLHCHNFRNYIVHLICCLSTKSLCHVAMSVSSFPSWHPPSSRGQACSGRALSSGSTRLSRPSIDSCWLFLSSLSEAASPSDSSRATIEVLRLLCLHAGVEAASVARGREGAI